MLGPDERLADARFVGSYWTRTNRVQVDLVGADRERQPTSAEFIGSIKWRETNTDEVAQALVAA